MRKFKKIYVLGAGAVGCFFGGMLARANKDVTLIARAERAQAINANGLDMQCQTFQELVSVKSSHDPALLSDADLILLCVKSPDTEKTIRQVASLIPKKAVILSMQNGVANVEIAAKIIPNSIYPVVVYVACGMAGHDVLKHHGRGELLLGSMEEMTPSDRDALTEICNLFEDANVPCMIAPNIMREMWLKFLVNCSYNAISGIGQIPYGEMVKVPEIVQLIEEIAKEVLVIASKKGVGIDFQEAKKANLAIAQTMATQISSTAQDLKRHKKTEIEYLNGYLIGLGKEYGVATPYNESVYAVVRMLESRF